MATAVATHPGLRVALVCAPEVLRLGLERVLAHEPRVRVRAHGRLDRVANTADVAVLCERGLHDPAASCAAATERLDAGVVVVAKDADPHLVLDCLAAGATGFVAEEDPPAHLRAAALAAPAGEYHLGPGVLAALLDWQRADRRRARSTETAERDLLALLAGGHTTHQIAAALGIAPKTVRNRASLLYRRLGVRSRAAAVRVAEERGLLDRRSGGT